MSAGLEITTARRAGTSWQKIGTILGTSPQAAQQRYGPIVEPAWTCASPRGVGRPIAEDAAAGAAVAIVGRNANS